MRRHPLLTVLGLLAFVVAAWGVAEVHYSRANNLDAGGRWISIKAQMGRTLEKSCRFTRTSVSVARNRLDLGAYFAYQEIVYHRALPVDELELRFQLSPDALLAVYTQHGDAGSQGLIVRAPPAVEGELFEADPEGGFTSLRKVPGLVADAGRWHHLLLSFQDAELVVMMDERELARLPVSPETERRIGFRSAQHTVFVDDVRIRGPFPEGELFEGFHGAQGAWGGRILALGAGLLAGVLAAGLLHVLSRRRRRAAWLTVPLFLACSLAVLAWMGALPLHWGPSWPVSNQLSMRINEVMAAFNVGYALLGIASCAVLAYAGSRQRWLARPDLQLTVLGLALAAMALPGVVEQVWFLSATYPWQEFTTGQGESCMKLDTQGHLEAIADRYPRALPPQTRRILFIGGSTTWGSGASSEESAWVGRVESALSARESLDGTTYQCVNAGICAQGSGFLLERLENEWIHLQPFMVVASMSVNEFRLNDYRSNLDRIVALCQERGIPLLFSLEPEAHSRLPTDLPRMHDIMSATARDHGIPLVDARAIADHESTRGWVWWDPVHLTDYGNRIYAEAVLPGILAIVEAQEREALQAAGPDVPPAPPQDL